MFLLKEGSVEGGLPTLSTDGSNCTKRPRICPFIYPFLCCFVRLSYVVGKTMPISVTFFGCLFQLFFVTYLCPVYYHIFTPAGVALHIYSFSVSTLIKYTVSIAADYTNQGIHNTSSAIARYRCVYTYEPTCMYLTNY